LKRKRYYGESPEDKAGILRYTKATEGIFDLNDIPAPCDERDLAWLLSFYWHTDRAYNSLEVLAEHLSEGETPSEVLLGAISQKCRDGIAQGLHLTENNRRTLQSLGIYIAE